MGKRGRLGIEGSGYGKERKIENRRKWIWEREED
jgi:hypothetical protein